MNGHPVVLEQRIEAVAFDEAQVVGVGKNGRVHGVPKQERRVAADAYLADVNAQNHDGNEHLDEHNHGQHRRFPVFCACYQQAAQYHMPEHPEQKAAFLPFPESREDVLERQVLRHMRPNVLILSIFSNHDVKQHAHRRKYAYGVAQKSAPAYFFPHTGLIKMVGALNGHEVRKGTEYGGYKCQQDTCVPDAPRPQVFIQIRNPLH